MSCRVAGSPRRASVIGVTTRPGCTEVTRMPVLARDVEAHEDALAALGADLRLDGLALLLQHVADDDARALAREQPGLRGTHAARAAADERNLACEPHTDLRCSRMRGSRASRTASPTK